MIELKRLLVFSIALAIFINLVESVPTTVVNNVHHITTKSGLQKAKAERSYQKKIIPIEKKMEKQEKKIEDANTLKGYKTHQADIKKTISDIETRINKNFILYKKYLIQRKQLKVDRRKVVSNLLGVDKKVVNVRNE